MPDVSFSPNSVEVPHVNTRNRRIQTSIPAPGTDLIIDKLARFESRSMHGQLPIVWRKAEGSSVYDIANNKFIDFTSTIFVTNIGHGNATVVSSLKRVLDEPLLHTYAYANEERSLYLEKLLASADDRFEKAFLMSAGTEATEAALKLMRMNARKQGKRRPGIVCIRGNWHGRTMGAQFMSDNESQKSWIGFEDPNMHYIDFPYEWELAGTDGRSFFEQQLQRLEEEGLSIEENVGGFMLEVYQGWGAVFYPKEFVQAIRDFCDRIGALLCFDEMQSGFARTGKMFGYEHYEVKADLICIGKGMGSGLPISGVLGAAEVMDLPEVGNMSSTHSANPLVCAAAAATLEVIEKENLVNRSTVLGCVMHERLRDIKNRYSNIISHIFGKGMLAAVVFRPKGKPICDIPSEISFRCMQKGLLVVHTGRESIKIAPPLTIEEGALLEGLDVLESCIKEFA